MKNDLTKIREDIIDYEKCEKRTEKSKYLTEEFFKKFPMKYRNLLEEYEYISFKNFTHYRTKTKSKWLILSEGLNGIDICEKVKNFENGIFWDIEDSFVELSNLLDNEEYRDFWCEARNLSKEEDNESERTAFINKIEKIIENELKDISNLVLKKAETHRIYGYTRENQTIEKIACFLQIQANIKLYRQNITENYFLIGTSYADPWDIHLDHFFINKSTGEIYCVIAGEEKLYKIADNFDEFIDELKILKSTTKKTEVYFLSNIHTHTTYCDGKNTIEEYILKAIENEFVSIGFSGHSYTYFDTEYCMTKDRTEKYLQEIQEMKEKYKDLIEVYSGIEADFYSNLNTETDKKMGLDYRIGSVHYIKDKKEDIYYPIDKSPETFEQSLQKYSDGNIIAFVNAYYDNIIKMIRTQKPTVLGHFDLIKKFNKNGKYFNEKSIWYKWKVNRVLNEISKAGTIIEVNTGGIAKGWTDEPYPSLWILEKIFKKNIPITLTSDAHTIENLDFGFLEIIKKLNKIGFQNIKILYNNIFKNSQTWTLVFNQIFNDEL